mmetsp:Transcript_44414/g.87164  ORF Transcript_44414/g.87164 Transcript_44414/m.87164 type:complete len:128 (-) Transcript_44414:647-1030(-)
MTDDPKSSRFAFSMLLRHSTSGNGGEQLQSQFFLSELEMDVVVILGNEEGDRRRPPNGFSARQFGKAPGYDVKKKEEMSCIKRALARQHSFVVADRKDEHNLFAYCKDVMRFDAGTIHPNTLASRAS